MSTAGFTFAVADPAQDVIAIGTIRQTASTARLLLAYPDLPVGPLERAERLEQLRALENGHRIRVVETEYESLASIRRRLVESVGIIRKNDGERIK